MRRPKLLRVAGRTSAAVAVVAFGLTPFAGMAFAGTPSAAAANAVTITTIPVTSGTETATNNGSQATDIEGATPALSVLGGQNNISAGVLQQTAVANSNGTSSSCAGLLGNGAEIQVGSPPVCNLTVGVGEVGGIEIGGPAPLGLIDANAIVETCEATPSGTTYTTQIIGLTIGGNPAIIPPQPVPVNDNLIPGLIELNRQVTTDGVTTATALYIPPLGISIGNVSCSSGSTTGVSSAFPTESWPIVLGTLVAMGLAYAGWSHRRQRRSQAAA